MQVLASFDPGAAMNGNLDVSAADSGCKILLYNLSIVAIKLNFENGATAILHAGEANYWELDGSTPTIEWSQYSVLGAAVGPLSMVTVTLYRPGEVLEGTYPFSLIYLLNLGNAIPLSTSASSITNTGNTAGTAIVTSTVSGDGNNAVSITNDAQVTFGDAMHNAVVGIVGTETVTDLLVTGRKIGKSSSGDIIDAGAGTDTYIKARGGKIICQSPNGTSLWMINPGTKGLEFNNVPIIYINTGAQETYIQMYGNGHIIFKDKFGNNIASLDSSGNMRLKGSLTQNTTP